MVLGFLNYCILYIGIGFSKTLISIIERTFRCSVEAIVEGDQFSRIYSYFRKFLPFFYRFLGKKTVNGIQKNF